MRTSNTTAAAAESRRRQRMNARSPRQTSLNGQLFQCFSLIQRAERDLGPLSYGQRSDLLLDNFEWIFDSIESHGLLDILYPSNAKPNEDAHAGGNA